MSDPFKEWGRITLMIKKQIRHMKKTTIRKLFLQKRLDLAQPEYKVLNAKMMDQIAKIDWGIYKNIHLFLSIAKFNEVNTFSMIDYWRAKYPQLQIIIPRTDFEKKEMEHVLFDPKQIFLEKNKFDIPEPVGGTLFPVEQIDSVLVPLLAFDKKGYRVGYGKGFYDRFLAQCCPNTQKIGLSFFDPVDEIADANDQDVKLNTCICPGKIWEF